uniref:NAD dependent epimerase/dehydratase family protein n=1 Tax=Candidatus Kentrum sp. LPFa TaxID=2126335 RepID=A0A450XWK5_9GAMM|nr:MAG: NAD dependent epimerase/dehydratase family protein [Candidatus Kentron sp. LPFa]VFK33694.1 MAG: NAD dependent epimerase/dehydratase family protein [Candidatus Kentron sp. LPFa]
MIWGSGTPKRELLHVDDMAAACAHVMKLPLSAYQAGTQPMLSHINVGAGKDCTIRQLAKIIAEITGFTGRLIFDASRPDGMPRKLVDVLRLKALGWQAKIGLEEGLRDTYRWFENNQVCLRN